MALTLTQNSAQGRTAVNLKWLVEFAERVPPCFTTGDVVTSIVVPGTSQYECRFCDLVSVPEAWGVPQWFVSHRWASKFQHLVNALKRHFGDRDGENIPDQVFVWLDIFAVNQHPGQAQADDLAKLQDVIRDTGKTLLVMDDRGQVLRRVWCLFEIFKTVAFKGVPNLVVLTHGVNLMGLKDIFIRINVAEAQATNDDDRQRILEDIRKTIGLTQLNDLIRRALVDSTKLEVEQVRQSVNRDSYAYFTALNKAAQMLTLAGQYGEAEPLMREALHLACQTHGHESVAAASCTNNLAEVLRYQGLFSEAEPLQRQALELSEKVVGQGHPIVATYLGNLAQLEMALGRPAAAEPLIRRALAISTNASDVETSEVAVLLNSLASLLMDMGQLEEAEQHYRLALTAIQKQLGPEDPEQVAYIANLAGLLQEREQHQESEQLLRKALSLCLRTLGSQHPMSATVMNNLGECLARQKRFDEAETMIRQALAIRHEVLGDEHPATANTHNNLGGLLMSQGKLVEAEESFRTSLAMSEPLLGVDHPVIANRLNNLASVLVEQGKVEEAEVKLREALQTRIKCLGVEHLDTAITMRNLANLLFERGKLEEARGLYKWLLGMLRPFLSKDSLLMTLTSLAMVQHKMNTINKKTLLLLREAIDLSSELHGLDSEETRSYRDFYQVVKEGLRGDTSSQQPADTLSATDSPMLSPSRTPGRVGFGTGPTTAFDAASEKKKHTTIAARRRSCSSTRNIDIASKRSEPAETDTKSVSGRLPSLTDIVPQRRRSVLDLQNSSGLQLLFSSASSGDAGKRSSSISGDFATLRRPLASKGSIDGTRCQSLSGSPLSPTLTGSGRIKLGGSIERGGASEPPPDPHSPVKRQPRRPSTTSEKLSDMFAELRTRRQSQTFSGLVEGTGCRSTPRGNK